MSANMSSMIKNYKKQLYADWLGGATVAELAEKYGVRIFKVNLIIEKEYARRHAKSSLRSV